MIKKVFLVGLFVPVCAMAKPNIPQNISAAKSQDVFDLAPNDVQIQQKDGKIDSITLSTDNYIHIMREQNKLPTAQQVLSNLLDVTTQQEVKAHLLYYLGIIAFELQQYEDAEKYFRTSLEYVPNYTQAELQLAGTLYVLQKYEASRHYFTKIKQKTADAELLGLIHGYLQKIADSRKIDYTFDMGLYPNSNVNSAPQVESYKLFGKTVKPTERPKSAVGISYDTSVYYKKRGRDNDIYTFTLAPSGTVYEENIYDSHQLTASALRLKQFTQGFSTQRIHITRSLYGGHKDKKNWGVSYSRGKYVNQKTVISLSLSWGHTNLIRDNYDVFKTTISPSVQYYITPKSSVTVALNRTLTSHDLVDRKGVQKGISTAYTRHLNNGIVLTPSVSFNRFVSDDEIVGFGAHRIQETIAWNVRVELTPYPIWKFVPTVRFGTIRKESTIKMDRATNNTFNIVFKRKF